jgi:hypothetical protein
MPVRHLEPKVVVLRVRNDLRMRLDDVLTNARYCVAFSRQDSAIEPGSM